MALFEITLLLLAIAVVFLQMARRLRVPYPSLLALAGGCVALVPFAPHLNLEPHLVLALFVAPAVMDTAFDMPPRELLRLWVPLVSLAVVLVLLTTAAVASAGIALAGLPVAAAIVLGAIVSPPDAVAAAALLRECNLPRRTMAVLQGESLLNDAVALLIFGLALTAALATGKEWHALAPRLLIAVPGSAVLGIAFATLSIRVFPRVAGTLSLIIVQFLVTYGTWIVAERMGLSPIVAVVALAGVVAWYVPGRTSARDRVYTNAVWEMVVFVLNVLAFLLMGLQARVILNQLQGAELKHALIFSGIVLGIVIVVRFAYVMLYGIVLRAFRRFFEMRVIHGRVPSARTGVLVSWCGMRGLVSLATALALPEEFPQRDLIVLSAFVVVLGTLILQGFTMRPLIALLRIAPDSSLDEDVVRARDAMIEAALAELQGMPGDSAATVRAELSAERSRSMDRRQPVTEFDQVRLRAIAAQRSLLLDWRRDGRLADDVYHLLEEELDRAELHAAPPADSSEG
jgi:CPA1 family monovalent cation:H+ antiporter